MFGVTNVIRFFRKRMYDLYDEKTIYRIRQGSNSRLQYFEKLQETSKGFKRSQTFSHTSRTSSDLRKLNKTSWDMIGHQMTSLDLQDFIELQKVWQDWMGLQETSEERMGLQVTWWGFQDFTRLHSWSHRGYRLLLLLQKS